MSERTIAAARRILARELGEEAGTFQADPHIQQTASGGRIVYFQQSYAGIPFFGSNIAVRLRDRSVRGEAVKVRRLDCMPTISAAEAVAAAVEHFAPGQRRSCCQEAHRSLRGKPPVPVITASFPLPQRPTVVSLGTGRTAAHVHLEFHERQLVWVVRMPFRTDRFLVLVAANGRQAREAVSARRGARAHTAPAR